MGGDNKRPLPEGWEWTTIGEVATTSSGGTPSRKHVEYYGGTIPWVKSGELGDSIVGNTEELITEQGLKKSSAKLFPSGTPLVALYGATVGKTGLLSINAATNQAVCAIIPRDSEFEAKYMIYWLRSQRNNLINQSVGGAQPNISQGIVKALPFPLAPLPEQQRIVAEIEKQFTRLDQAVASLKRAQANLQRYKASVLKAACEGKLVPQDPDDEPAEKLLERILTERRARWEEEAWVKLVHKAQKKVAQNGRKAQGLPARLSDLEPKEWQDIPEADYARYLPKNDTWKEKYKEPEGVDTAVMAELPEGWVWATPEQLSSPEKYSLAIGPFGSNLKVVDYQDEGVPLIFVRHIRSGIFDAPDTKFVSMNKADELKAHTVNGGEVLITKMGDPPGDAILYPETMPEAIITADCMKWKLSRHLEEKRYFVHAINSQVVHQQILSITRGVAQLKVSLGRFKTINIPLPPLAEQEGIVAKVEQRLSVISANEKAIANDLARAKRLRQSILQQAFSGRLVPQEPVKEHA